MTYKKIISCGLCLCIYFSTPTLQADTLPWHELESEDWWINQNYTWTDDLMSDAAANTQSANKPTLSRISAPVSINENSAMPRSNVQIRPATYRYPVPRYSPDMNLDEYLDKKSASREGLLQLRQYLQRQNPAQRVGQAWVNTSNADLMATINALLNWHEFYLPESLSKQFDLLELGSHTQRSKAQYTGYFTPLVDVREQPDFEFRFPVYAAPYGHSIPYSRAEIAAGALQGRGLELAWTNDPVNLFFAHIQGSAIARFPNGRERLLSYVDSNHRPYKSIANYLRRYYMSGSLSNENIRRWLHDNPQYIREVLNQNPRYVFFKWADSRPKTATGGFVIPWHTVAVDDQYIPLGSVLLAEIPRVDATGQVIGSDWRLLFAQDRGAAIKGPGRLDLYTGAGGQAERATYSMTGFRKTYLLLHRSFERADYAGL